MYRSPHATVRLVALVPILIPVLLSFFVTSAPAARSDEPVIVGTPTEGQVLPTSRVLDAASHRKFAVDVGTVSQTMETANFVFTLPEPGRGTVIGTVADDERHNGAEADHHRSAGRALVAFSRTFASGPASTAEVPVTLSAPALNKIRQRGFLRVTLRTEFTPIGAETAQKYKSVVKLRPFSVTAHATDSDSQTATATLRTPRPGRLVVKFHLRDRVTDKSIKIKSFAVREVAGGSYTYTAPLTAAARRAIIIGKVLLMVTARLETAHYSARMLRSRLIRCRYCGVR